MISFGVVSPSFNQCRYLPQAVESVMAQRGNFPIDYLVMDGGSNDSSVAYLRDTEKRFRNVPGIRFSWESAPDQGQYAAVQEGFSRVKGNVLCWLNSDDAYMPWTFAVLADILEKNPQVAWITSVYPMTIAEQGASVGVDVRWGYTRGSFRKWVNLPGGKHYARYFIQQDCTFWRRSLWEKAGDRFDNSLRLAADYELWLRFFDHAQLYAVASPLASYRVHAEQKTALIGAYEEEAAKVMKKHRLKPLSGWQCWLRKRLIPVLKAMRLASMLTHLKLLEAAQIFKHGGRGRNWQLVEKYIF